MLDRTQKRVGHGREREVGDGRRGVRREEKGKVSSYIDECDRVSHYILLGCLCVVRYVYDNVHIYHSNSQLTA